MNLSKQIALSGYYYGSLPYRWLIGRRLQNTHRVPVSILFYHRVADTEANDWTISCAQFRAQICWIRERFEIVSLAEAQRRLREGNRTPTVCLTFDDGYADNCDWALPWLIEQQLPCTYFVTSQHVLQGQPFAHDVSRGVPLAPNTPDQIRALADAGVEIGGHTRTHIDLGSVVDEQRMEDEVLGGAEELTRITSLPVRYFAFPFGQHGNLDSRVFNVLRDADFDGACSAYGGHNFPTPPRAGMSGADRCTQTRFHLQRIHGDAQIAPIKNWLTLDPRKLHVPEYTVRWTGERADVAETVEV